MVRLGPAGNGFLIGPIDSSETSISDSAYGEGAPMTAIRPRGSGGRRHEGRIHDPEFGSWIGEVARAVRDVVDSTPRTIRLCALIAVAAASWAFLR
ncbi:hypothetical protein SAMN05421833_122154 [Microbispora rosea]|uniref:Uncharacterized protein n=2 Tax=Microbispora TaxID=2005 RepID=A0A1N7FLK5_9ACTN|nr:hypothetical protein Mro03_55710 [Microbispora rosea subsp. rosea]SIS01154.1 hypothetical protein SAMN05421833_122154 [Microbispora rosea]